MEYSLLIIFVCATAAVMADFSCRVCVARVWQPSWWIATGAAFGASLVIAAIMFYLVNDGFSAHRFWSESAVPLLIAVGLGSVVGLAPAALVVSQYRKKYPRMSGGPNQDAAANGHPPQHEQ